MFLPNKPTMILLVCLLMMAAAILPVSSLSEEAEDEDLSLVEDSTSSSESSSSSATEETTSLEPPRGQIANWLARLSLRRPSQQQQQSDENESEDDDGGDDSRALDTTRPRDLGLMFALKALILGPLIGLTLGKALLRGLIWALLAYAVHLFVPGILSVVGLGSGLVGFARQMRPDYAQMIVHTLINLHDEFHRLPPVPINDANHINRHY